MLDNFLFGYLGFIPTDLRLLVYAVNYTPLVVRYPRIVWTLFLIDHYFPV